MAPRSSRQLIAVAGAILFLLSTGAQAAPICPPYPPGVPEAAARARDEAVVSARAGRWDEALGALARAQAIAPDWAELLFLRSGVSWGKLAPAAAIPLLEDPSPGADYSSLADGLGAAAADLDRYLSWCPAVDGAARVAATAQGLRERALLARAAATILAERAAAETARLAELERVRLADLETARALAAELEWDRFQQAVGNAQGVRTAGWVFASVGLALGAGALAALLVANGETEAIRAGGFAQAHDITDAAERAGEDRTAALMLGVGGAVFLAIGTPLVLANPDPTRPAVSLEVGPQGAGVRVSGVWP